MKAFFFGEKIPEQELKECEGFKHAQEHLLYRLDQDWNKTLPIKYQYDQSLRKARIVWFEHFMGPVALPTGILLYVSSAILKQPQLRAAAILASLGSGAKLYMNEYKSFDLNTEKTYKVLMCPTPIGKECRDILKSYNPDHWILDKYKLETEPLRRSMAEDEGAGYRQWKNRKQYSSDIFEEDTDSDSLTVERNGDDDSDFVLDEEMYGKSKFIPEYPLPEHEATYATRGYSYRKEKDEENEKYENAKDNVIAIRPESRFMKEGMWPKALIESENLKKNEDKAIFRDFGVDIDNDNEMKQELLSDVPQRSMYSDEKCWEIEEEWRRCKLMVRKGKTKASECKKLKSDMKMCRGLAAMARIKDL